MIAICDGPTMANDTFTSYPGSRAYSEFRLKALERETGAVAVRAIWVHHVQTTRALEDEEVSTLLELLKYGQPPDQKDWLEEELVAAVAGSR